MTDRLESLDVFRGTTIAAMILVSTPGTWDAVYQPLQHAAWHGWTPTDLVFPFLLFAMGAAVPFALARRRVRPAPVTRHVVRRAVVLFLLGIALNAIETQPPLVWATFRIAGVLQRIGIVYLAVALLTERTSRRTQAVVATAALVGYWAAMTLIPVSGAGSGVLTPEGNLASAIDRRVLDGHMATPLSDPEGILSTIPAVASALFGVFAGDWLVRPRAGMHRSVSLIAAGIVAAAVALAWDHVFPINKNLWTSSFALLAGGLGAATLGAFHWLLDVKRWRGWELPLVALGRNPLTAYFLSVAGDAVLTRWMVSPDASLKDVLFERGFASWIAPCCGREAASACYAASYVALWTMVTIVMYRRRIFVGI
jgi:predicted acyltransferase